MAAINELEAWPLLSVVVREEGRGARRPGSQVTRRSRSRFKVQGGQATRRGVRCQTQRRTAKTCCYFLFRECPLSSLAMARRNAYPRFLARFRDLKRPKHLPRSPVGAHTCGMAYPRAPCVPRSQQRDKRTAARRNRNRGRCTKKVNLRTSINSTYTYLSLTCW